MVRVVCEGKTDKNKLKEILDLGVKYTEKMLQRFFGLYRH